MIIPSGDIIEDRYCKHCNKVISYDIDKGPKGYLTRKFCSYSCIGKYYRHNLVPLRKGYTPWNTGKHLSQEHRNKVSKGLKRAFVEGRMPKNVTGGWNKGIGDIKRICTYCKKEYIGRKNVKKVYCSRKCHISNLKVNIKGLKRYCQMCGNELIYEPKRGIAFLKKKFCSQRCVGKNNAYRLIPLSKGHIPWNKGKKMSDEFRQRISEAQKGKIPKHIVGGWNKGVGDIKRICSYCKKDYIGTKYTKKIYCSWECQQAGNRIKMQENKYGYALRGRKKGDSRVEKVCAVCKKLFKIYPYSYKVSKYCSKKCRGLHLRGKNHYLWKSIEHKRKIRKFGKQRYMSLKRAAGPLSIKRIQMVYEDNVKKYGTLTCMYCLNPIEFGKDTLEHKQPLSRGGTNDYNNLGIACSSCNSAKHTKTEKEYKIYLK